MKKASGENPAELAQCKKKLEIMNIELEVYREIGGLVVKGSPRSSLLNRLMDFALKAVDADSGALYLLDRSGNLKLEVVRGLGAGTPRSLELKARKGGIAGRSLSACRPLLGQGGLNGRQPALKAAKGAGINTLAVPLLMKKAAAGVIEVSSKAEGKPFASSDVKVLASLANHFSIIMERAELFSELDGRIKQFSALNEIGNLLISTLDQAVIRRKAMEAITTLMRAETGSLLLLDAERNELYFEVALGEKGKKLKKVRLKVGEGIAGWVAENGKALIIPDVSADSRFQGNVDKRSKFKTKDMVCVPLAIKGKVIGVLQAINRTGGSFTKDDLRLFQLFSNQVAIALDNARLYEEIKETFYATSGALAEAIEKRDPYTGGHTKRVLSYCLAMGRYLDLPKEAVEVLKLSAVLHDIGKIGIADSVLRKDAPLNSEEAESMRLHPQFGAEILKHVPQLKDIVPGMLYHHERVDGLGYPEGYKQDEIPLIARIIAVADTYDAMTTTRPYRKGLPPSAALKELRKCSGKQFDSDVVNAFMKAFRKGEINGKARHDESLQRSIQL